MTLGPLFSTSCIVIGRKPAPSALFLSYNGGFCSNYRKVYSGLSLAVSRLYVADTNNHAVRLVDLDAGRVRTLEIMGV